MDNHCAPYSVWDKALGVCLVIAGPDPWISTSWLVQPVVELAEKTGKPLCCGEYEVINNTSIQSEVLP